MSEIKTLSVFDDSDEIIELAQEIRKNKIKKSFPRFLQEAPDFLFTPQWWSMDGQEPRVYAINVNKSIKSNRILMDDAY